MFHKLYWDDSNPPVLPEIPTPVSCGSNSIVATGLTDHEISICKLVFTLPFAMKYWNFESPSLVDIAIVYQKLLGVTL